ncbi:MAG TPA: hypothetical protein VGB65_00215 [Allosphingosinicella sp.]|jgi:hypothetical protein
MHDREVAATKSHWILRGFGWLFGGLSLIKLIEDLDLIKLYGALQDWTSAYGMFVAKVGDFLFGWIDWRWLKIEDIEYHVIVLATLLGGAVGRATYSTLLRRSSSTPGADAFGIAVAFVIISIFIVVVLPATWSLWLGIGFLSLGSGGMITKDNKNSQPDVDPRDLAREVVVVAAIFIAVLLVNYLIMKP